jgi:hypothetical protein
MDSRTLNRLREIQDKINQALVNKSPSLLAEAVTLLSDLIDDQEELLIDFPDIDFPDEA